MMSPSRATLLFYIATHTLVARATSSVGSGDASATSGLGSDDAISSGDDDHGGSETTSSTLVPMCHAPSYSDVNRIQRNLTQEEREKLVIEGRCYLTCTTLTERFNQTKGEVRRNENSSIPYWPYMTVQRGCAVTQEIHECTRGCIENFGSVNTRRNPCARAPLGTCVTGCHSECNGRNSCANPVLKDPWIHSGCPLMCTYNPCLWGCGSQLPDSGQLPRDPVGQPTLNRVLSADRVWQFMVDLSTAAPRLQGNDRMSAIAPVAFLFRVELTATHDVSFIWATNPFAQLDLADYACQEVDISFAVVNKVGQSNFSDSVQFFVHVERLIPHPPTNLHFSSEIDKRIGLFGHALLNISWNEPQNTNYLENYIVMVSTLSSESTVCQSQPAVWNRTVPANITSVMINAETNVTLLPHMGCSYNAQVFAVGVDGRSNSLNGTYTIPHFATDDIIFQCERLWDSQEYLFSYNLTWTIPAYIRHDSQNIISGFWLDFMMLDVMGRTILDIPRERVQFPQNASAIVSKLINANVTGDEGSPYLTPRHDSSQIVFFQTTVIWSRNLTYRPVMHNYSCTASTLSPAPSTVNNLTVTSYCFRGSDEITLDFSWSPPSTFNGVPANYNICIATEALENSQGVVPDMDHICASESLFPELTNATVTLMITRKTSNSTHLYFQIRANNKYVPSDWSEPYLIPLVLDSAECNTQVSSGPERIVDDSSTSNDGPERIVGDSSTVNDAGIIVGSTLGGLLLALILVCSLIAVLWYIKMMRKRKRLLRITEDHCIDPMYSRGPKSLLLHKPTEASLISPPRDEWELPANEVIIEDCLGEGAFGEVYKGVVKCPIINPRVRSSVKNAFCTPVAIKLLKVSAKGNERQDFLSEIEMMKKVAEGQNPHVVSLLGCVTIQEPLCLITEFVKYGDLLSYLRTNRRICTGSGTEEDAENDAYIELGNVSPVDLISFAYQIASGMEYLSSLGIVHRDLACRNILVDEGKVLKISDLGMSRETDEIYVQKRTGRVPLKWMAIESIIAREFTSASDVWSYGVTLWEIGTLGGFPYPSIQNEDLLSLLKRGHRMEKPDNCSAEVYDIMLMCWNEEPQRRPKFTELRSKFDAMLLAERKDAYIDLRIDNDKPYYRLDTTATIAAKGLHLSPNPSRHSFKQSSGSGISSRNGSKECSLKPLHTPEFSPSHKSEASCYNSSQMSPRKQGIEHLPPSSGSFGRQFPFQGSCENAQRGSDVERRGRARAQEQGRPVSLLLPRDQERRDRQNPYVDEPSRAAATILAHSNGSERRTRRGSDGMIEMNPRSGQDQNGVIEILITGEQT